MGRIRKAATDLWHVRPSAWALVAGGILSLIFSLLLAIRVDRTLSVAVREEFALACAFLSVGTYQFAYLSVLLEEYRGSGDSAAFELALTSPNKRSRLVRATLFGVAATVIGFAVLLLGGV